MFAPDSPCCGLNELDLTEIIEKCVSLETVEEHAVTTTCSETSLREELNCRKLVLDVRPRGRMGLRIREVRGDYEIMEASDDKDARQPVYKQFHLLYYTRPTGLGHRLRIKEGYDKQLEFFRNIKPTIEVALMEQNFAIDEFSRNCIVAERSCVCFDNYEDLFRPCVDPLDEAQIKAAARAMARMHTYSRVASRALEKPIYHEYPKVFKDNIFTKTYGKALDLFAKMFEEIARDLKCKEPNLIREYVRMVDDRAWAQREGTKLKYAVCLGHADTRYMLFSPQGMCLLDDFTNVEYAPRMLDLARLLYFNNSPAKRRRIEDRVIEAYYQEMCEIIGDDADQEAMELHELEEEYREAEPMARMLSVCYYPTMKLPKSLFHDFNHDPAEYCERYFGPEQQGEFFRLYDTDMEFRRNITDFTRELVKAAEDWKEMEWVDLDDYVPYQLE